MKLPIYQIDAFASQAFTGNPAAVMPLEEWLPDETMQSIAAENNLAETAFFVKEGDGFYIRWFTPTAEVDLCGHATLASGFVCFNYLGWQGDVVKFTCGVGELTVERKGDIYELDFPSRPPHKVDTPPALQDALGVPILECLVNEKYVVVLESEAQLAELKPNLSLLQTLGKNAVTVTAASANYDFVVRVFAPKVGIPEDPVTGSAYTELVPYWAERLGKTVFNAKQISARGGELQLALRGDRVKIAGKAVMFLTGDVELGR